MQVKHPSTHQYQIDPEWLREFTYLLNKNGNKKKIKEVKKIFEDVYSENIRAGMNPKEAVQKAKSIALCFLMYSR